MYFLYPQTALPADNGIVAKKILYIDKPDSGTFVFIGGRNVGIQKGPAGSLTALTAILAWSDGAEGGAGSVFGAFDTAVGSPQWTTNTDVVAKYVNTSPCGETCLKSIVVKAGQLFKTKSEYGSDPGQGGGSLFFGPPTAADGILVVATITNATDGSTHRMCTRFATDLGSKSSTRKRCPRGSGGSLLPRAACRLPAPRTWPSVLV